jgi:TonB family protein
VKTSIDPSTLYGRLENLAGQVPSRQAQSIKRFAIATAVAVTLAGSVVNAQDAAAPSPEQLQYVMVICKSGSECPTSSEGVTFLRFFGPRAQPRTREACESRIANAAAVAGLAPGETLQCVLYSDSRVQAALAKGRGHFRTLPSTGRDFPSSDMYYPPISRRSHESGVTAVRVCIAADGTVAEATIDKSSGSKRLDDAALELTRAGSGRFTPGTEDGKPIAGCFVYKIAFVDRG